MITIKFEEDLSAMPEPEICWTRDQAIELATNLEAALGEKAGIHVALTGSCLYRGTSGKDADILLYPRKLSKGITLNEAYSKFTRLIC